MSTPDDDAAIAAAEAITTRVFAEINVEEFQTLLFKIGGMLAVWRVAMIEAGYSPYFVEKSAWVMFTRFYGHHMTETLIPFEPDQSIQQGRSSSDQGGAGAVHGPEGPTES